MTTPEDRPQPATNASVARSTTGGLSTATTRYILSSWIGVMLLIAALVLLLPLHLENLKYGVGAISIVAGAAGVGGILSADLIGRLATQINPAHLVRGGVAVKAACVVGIGLVNDLVLLVTLSVITGVCISAVRVGVQMIVRNTVSDDRRGRVHGAQGFISRVMMLAAPAAIGFLWQNVDALWSFVGPAMVAALALVIAGSVPPLTAPKGGTGEPGRQESVVPLATLIRYGSGPVLYTAARSGRMLLLPLVGLAAEMSPARIGLLVSLSAAADVLVAPASGPIMDRRGRLTTIVPSFSLMALGFVVLALAANGWMLAAAAIVLGVGNGISSGLLLTLGTDLAPKGNEGPFLGRFGAMNDSGRLLGPFLVGVLGEQLGLGAAAFTLAGVTAIALVCVLVFVGETKPAALAA